MFLNLCHIITWFNIVGCLLVFNFLVDEALIQCINCFLAVQETCKDITECASFI